MARRVVRIGGVYGAVPGARTTGMQGRGLGYLGGSRGTTARMKVITARVVNGAIQVPPEVIDGTTVAVLAPDTDGFHLTGEQENELSSALAEIRLGSFVDGDELLAELRGAPRA
jgi:hypothetical protein